jgi:hypothetical protein
MNTTKLVLAWLAVTLIIPGVWARDTGVMTLDLVDEDSVDIRHYKSEGDKLLLGFACDSGNGVAQMAAAAMMADDEVEVWMPDLLSAHFLPDLKSSLREIPDSDVVRLINTAMDETGKVVYLLSSGSGSALLLRGLAEWEQQNPERLDELGGVVLLFPRLYAASPEPGRAPLYIDAVGKTKTPVIILEGEKTPNKWALPALAEKMRQGGSPVSTSIIPGVRGYFYKQKSPYVAEDIVSNQLSGLIKASLVKLDWLRRDVAQG